MTAARWLFFSLISLAALIYVLGLEPAEDATSLLPDGSRGKMELLEEMGLTNKVFISLQYEESDPAGSGYDWKNLKESTAGVGRLLEASPLLTRVHYQLDQADLFRLPNFLTSHLPVLLDKADLREIEKKISSPQLEETLKGDFLQLNSLAGLALKDRIIHDPLNFSELVLSDLDRLKGRLKVNIKEGFFTSPGGKSTLIWAESGRPLTNSKHAALVRELIRNAVRQGADSGISARISGPLLHTLANSRAIKADLKLLLPLASLALAAFLILGTGSLRIFPVLAIPFLAAPVAISVLSLFHDRISIMALGFGIVLLGLSVDFAVHIFLCREDDEKDGLKHLRKPLLLAWITSISCFGVLLLSSVPSHRQMALLAVTGISWALVLAWQLIPTISGPAGSRKVSLSIKRNKQPGFAAGPLARIILIGSWIILILGGLLVWPHLSYNGSLETFDVHDPKVAADEDFFKQRWGTGENMIFAAASAPDLNQALNINDRLYKALAAREIAEFQSVAPILPGPERQRENLENWRDFWDGRIQPFEERLTRAAIEAGFSPGAFSPFLKELTAPVDLLQPNFLSAQGLSPLFSSLIRPPEPGDSGRWLILTFIPENRKNNRLPASLEKIDGLAIVSHQSWRQEVESGLRLEIRNLSLYAALIIIGLTTLLFRSFRVIVAVLAPMISALSTMALFAFFSAGGINLMHVLMAIMVMGLSVDYGIFTVCNRRDHISPHISRAVAICAVSSLIGFGVLALARHPALQSLGITVLAGIGLALPTALWISPLFLNKSQK